MHAFRFKVFIKFMQNMYIKMTIEKSALVSFYWIVFSKF